MIGTYRPAVPLSPPPPLTALGDLGSQLGTAGFAVLSARSLAGLASVEEGAFDGWASFWDDLAVDEHLRDHGSYRRRRHGSFVLDGERLERVPHRAHWQPTEYNALHGGIERWFEPLDPALADDPAFDALVRGLCGQASALRGPRPWFVEVHPFRIDASDGIGRPTPEGAHRDGVDLVAVILVARRNIKGGETRVFDLRGPQGMRFTMAEPWSALLIDDARVVHESTPIQPREAGAAHRDTLVVTIRGAGFQSAGR